MPTQEVDRGAHLRRDERARRVDDPHAGLERLGYEAPEFRASLAMLEKTLAEMEVVLARTPWLAGDRPSLGDIAVLPYVISAEKFGIAGMMLAQRPGIRRWLDAWRQRPTYAATMPWELPPALVEQARTHSVAPWQAIRSAG